MIGLLMLAAVSPNPVFFTGNDLYTRCRQPDTTGCMAYVMGVHDTLADLSAVQIIKSQLTCPSRLVTPEQLKDVVVAYLRDNPAARGQGAAGLTAAALLEAFPCQPKGG